MIFIHTANQGGTKHNSHNMDQLHQFVGTADFRDIFEDGLSFNTIKGNFRLNKGVADSDNLVVDAIPAKISLTGNVDLTNKTLDQLVRVIPKSADAVPIVGTIINTVVDMASRTLTGKSRVVGRTYALSLHLRLGTP